MLTVGLHNLWRILQDFHYGFYFESMVILILVQDGFAGIGDVE